MKTISKIKNVQGNGSFENQYGAEQPDGKKLLFKFEYEFEDGISMMANHKTNTPPFPIGDEVEYEVTRDHPDFGKSGKVYKPQQNNFNGKNQDYVKGIEVGHAVNNAVNLLCAGFEFKDILAVDNEDKIKQYARKILGISNDLKNE